MAKQPRIVAGQTVAITGGARGIGRATAQALSRAGMRVAIGDLDLQTARATAQELGPTAIALHLDVTDRESFTQFLDATESELGPLDALVNNAGIMQLGKFIDEDDLTAQRMIDINLHGVILGMKLGLRRMVARGQGHIVNIASQAGRFGAPGGATYSATKHAVVGLTEAVRGELRLMGLGDQVRLSYVLPFVVDTELGGGLGRARGMNTVKPSEVAEGILRALQYDTVDVWVPSSARRTLTFGSLLPRRLAEGMARAMRADRVLADADPSARKAYELRASASEPALQAGGESEQAEITERAGS